MKTINSFITRLMLLLALTVTAVSAYRGDYVVTAVFTAMSLISVFILMYEEGHMS